MPGELELLAYETALRTLDRQDHLLQELRARTGVLLAASSLAVSLMGQISFDHSQFPGLLMATVAVFVVAVTAGIYVLVPRRDLSFSPSASAIYERLYGVRNSIPEVHRQLVYELDDYRSRNHKAIRNLTRGCQVSGIALALEIAVLATWATVNII